jgi:hypothetical protein
VDFSKKKTSGQNFKENKLHTTQFVEDSNVDIPPWPAWYPDLYPTERIWDLMSRGVGFSHGL